VKILVVEDDSETAAYLVNGLTEHGHVVDHVPDGRAGLFMAVSEKYDVLVVDRLLPELDGLGVVKSVRGAGVKTPVLFLTALGGIDDRVQGLDSGADDYLVKPFAFSELVARVNALARRPALAAAEPTVLRVADLELDLLKRMALRGGRRIDLQPREFRLLEYLMRHAGQVVTRTMLLEQVWDFHFDPRTSVVETHISRLRAKLNGDDGQDLIHTVRGAGYTLREPR
jgi:two-component system OmpR family response regulator